MENRKREKEKAILDKSNGEKIAGDRVLGTLNKKLVESEKELKLIKEQIKILSQDI